MAETTIPQAPAPLPTMEEVAAQNAEVARTLADQDINGKLSTSKDASADSALDALAAQITKKAEDDLAAQPTEEEKAAAAEKKIADDKVAAEKIAADKIIADKAAADNEEANKIFKDSPSLPANASPKSSEAFNSVKAKAAHEITNRDKKILELEAQLKERDEKLKNPVPAEIHKELEDLRSFRARLDIEADPQFKQFDKTIASHQEFIYAQLKKSPKITDAVINEIKKWGGPEMVDMSKIFDAIGDPTIKRNVEAKISDIEQAVWQKDEAIKAMKTNVSDYVKKREEDFSKSATAHNEATRSVLTELSAKLPWFAPKIADAKADEATKKAVEAHNAFVADTKVQLEGALNDDSPQMRGIMLAATAQLLYLQKVHGGTMAELTAVKKENAELLTKLDKFKNASVSRLRESGAVNTGKNPAPKQADIFTTRAAESLDAIRDQVVSERERAAAGA